MIALNERLPDAFKLLRPPATPAGEGRRRSLRQWSLTAAPLAPTVTPGRHRRGWRVARRPSAAG
jgi:hypothetical protein